MVVQGGGGGGGESGGDERTQNSGGTLGSESLRIPQAPEEKRLRIQEGEVAGENAGLTELPTDIISNILSRLPVKTLLRFKCVSKSWCSIIDHRSFADLVLAQSLGRSDVTSLISIIGNIEPRGFGRWFFSLDHQTGLATPLRQLHHNINSKGEDSQSVNGLICFDVGDLTYLCNLSTREVRALPPTYPDFPVHLHRGIHSFSALGFDPVAMQYKVMKTWVLNAVNHSGEVITAHKILTLGTSSWRKIDSGPIDFPWGGSVCINGAIHFLTLDLMSNKIIVAFDVGTEKFRTLTLPDGALNQVHKMKLIPFGDRLTVLDYEHLEDENIMLMYILEDDKNQVWTERRIVLPLSWREYPLHSERFLVGSVRAGEILLAPKVTTGEVYFLSYDVENGTLKKVQVRGLPPSLLRSPVIIACAPIGYVHSILALSEDYS
ncbi:F-box protein At5g65850-like [Rhodamnia argentea]|uniref:F-box protein At5g65850-like n=1 Tax=Rhodamnia argentea TaxID=178133 RepID=A0A8B8QRQ4_9MYRT|nr:F-box protein At5g65850-like [Rhodamnia argentea]